MFLQHRENMFGGALMFCMSLSPLRVGKYCLDDINEGKLYLNRNGRGMIYMNIMHPMIDNVTYAIAKTSNL